MSRQAGADNRSQTRGLSCPPTWSKRSTAAGGGSIVVGQATVLCIRSHERVLLSLRGHEDNRGPALGLIDKGGQ